MNPEAIGRAALSGAVAVLAASVMLQQCQDPPTALKFWLCYTMACGTLINTREGERPTTLLLAAALPALVPMVAVAYASLATTHDGNVCFSGAGKDNPRFQLLLGFAFTASWIAIFLVSFARNLNLELLGWLRRNDTHRELANIDSALRALVSIAGALVLLFGLLRTV